MLIPVETERLLQSESRTLRDVTDGCQQLAIEFYVRQ